MKLSLDTRAKTLWLKAVRDRIGSEPTTVSWEALPDVHKRKWIERAKEKQD